MDKEQIKELGEKAKEELGELKEDVQERLESEAVAAAKQKVKEAVKKASNKNSLLDKMLGKVISRKLLVFVTATILLAQYGLDPDTWGMIAIVYIGGQSVVDTMKMWRHGR
jgi:mevalonate kinase